jgi:hypothetical protein
MARACYDVAMATRLRGWEAIAFAERNGCLLCAHAGQGEPARDGVSVAEARRIAAARPERIYVDFDEPEGPMAA